MKRRGPAVTDAAEWLRKVSGQQGTCDRDADGDVMRAL